MTLIPTTERTKYCFVDCGKEICECKPCKRINRMKTLEQILSEYGLDIEYNPDFYEELKCSQKEYAKEALRLASENAKTVRIAKDGSWSSISPMIRTAKALHYVDKKSIISEENIPKEVRI